jgi:hypothetical protein
VNSLADLRPGDCGFGPISGAVGALVGAGELAVAPFDHIASWREWRTVRHCGWVVDGQQVTAATAAPGVPPVSFTTRGPLFAQAMPTGFEIIEMGDEHWTDQWVYLRPNYVSGQADRMCLLGSAMARAKTPYGFEDYAAIAGHRLGLHSKGLDDFIARTDPATGLPQRAICSQALDAAFTLSGGLVDGKVFDDGRLAQDVTPSELYLRLLGTFLADIIRPGVS